MECSCCQCKCANERMSRRALWNCMNNKGNAHIVHDDCATTSPALLSWYQRFARHTTLLVLKLLHSEKDYFRPLFVNDAVVRTRVTMSAPCIQLVRPSYSSLFAHSFILCDESPTHYEFFGQGRNTNPNW